MDIDKDKKGGLARTHQNSLMIIHEMKETLDLVDVWRIFNPDDKRYTSWRQRRPMVQCRLDFFLVGQSILGNITLADIWPGYKTDHSVITPDLFLSRKP